MGGVTMEFWAFFATPKSDGAILSCIPSGGPRNNKYRKAKSIKDKFPDVDDAVMCFDPNYPENVVVYDFTDCLDGITVVNARTKKLFEEEGVTEEFLEVRLWDHRDRVVEGEYYIFNCLKTLDFIDMEQSELSMHPTFPDRVFRPERLVVKKDLAEHPKIFVPVNMTKQLFISDYFKRSLETAGIEGFKVFEADGWDGLDV